MGGEIVKVNELFNVEERRAQLIFLDVYSWFVEHAEGKMTLKELIGKVRSEYEGREREYALYMIGRLLGASDEAYEISQIIVTALIHRNLWMWMRGCIIHVDPRKMEGFFEERKKLAGKLKKMIARGLADLGVI